LLICNLKQYFFKPRNMFCATGTTGCSYNKWSLML